MTPERYARIKGLFSEAAPLNATERRAFLARECDDDVDLRREVESLLDHDDSQTIIRADDETLPIGRSMVVRAPQRPLSKQLRAFSTLTKHLGPRGYLAIGALMSCGILALLGYLGDRGILEFQKELRRGALNEIVDAKVVGLEMWLDHELEKIQSWSRSSRLRRDVSALVKLADESENLQEQVRSSPLQLGIGATLHSFAGKKLDFSIWDRRHLLVADTLSDGARIGSSVTPWGAGVLAFVFEGKPRLFAMDKQRSLAKLDESTQFVVHICTVTPIRNENDQIIAALLVHDYDSRESASRILQMVRLGESGETYVFNRNGLMLTESRFDDQLREIGLLPHDPDVISARYVHLRDPGGDLTSGFELEEPLSARPLTKMARFCTAGNDGDDLEGYRDYRGKQVVGAWRWLDELGVGVATELDLNELEPGLNILIWESRIIISMFAVCLGIALLSYYSIHQLRQQVGKNSKLGQYTLENQLGEGGMGKVFKARHELLKRSTAVKLLKPELVDRESIARFEREASLVSQLEHTNTIRVYDYGMTPEGLFYYVMEYLDGLSLAELVALEGALTPERTVFLLRQMCCSLREAHHVGLVHRDLKPSNIMVCRHGGDFDVVKVLDFGLVKRIETSRSQEITSTECVAGTPQYIAPERLSDPQANDPRSDIYALGAVTYFLLTGRDFIDGGSLAEVLYRVVSAPPLRPSDVTDADIPSELDELVYRCLAKEPADRVASISEIIVALDSIRSNHVWTQEDAQSWWNAHAHRLPSVS